MEPRRWRPQFFNPFTEKRKNAAYIPLYRGFFRVLPLHRWGIQDISRVLGYAAVNPSLFGFPDKPTCIVNTAYFLPSYRSLLRGVWAFGSERGCKTIIIPLSCNREDFDEVDAKLIEPLFRWNPGVEYVYLSQHCQRMAPALAAMLGKCHALREITLEGWNDPVAIHRVAMACKKVEVIDTYTLDDPPREWGTELAVQALCTLIEMHPKLRCVKSHRLYLADWYNATRFSRCKHNIALVPFSCDFVLLFYMLFLMVLWVPAYAVYRTVAYLTRDTLSEGYVWFWSVMAFLATFGALVAGDMLLWSSRGRGWVYMQKYFILAKRRIDIMMNVHHTAITTVK